MRKKKEEEWKERGEKKPSFSFIIKSICFMRVCVMCERKKKGGTGRGGGGEREREREREREKHCMIFMM